MTFKAKVEKIVLDILANRDVDGIVHELKEKTMKQLTPEITRDFESKFNKYLTLKGEDYIKPLIVGTVKDLVTLDKYKDHEKELRRVVTEEIEKIRKEIKKEMAENV